MAGLVLVYRARPFLSPGGNWGRGEAWVEKTANVIIIHDS